MSRENFGGTYNGYDSRVPIALIINHLKTMYSINSSGVNYGEEKANISFTFRNDKLELNPEYSFLDYLNPLTKTKAKFIKVKHPNYHTIAEQCKKHLNYLGIKQIHVSSNNGELKLQHLSTEEMYKKIQTDKLTSKLNGF